MIEIFFISCKKKKKKKKRKKKRKTNKNSKNDNNSNHNNNNNNDKNNNNNNNDSIYIGIGTTTLRTIICTPTSFPTPKYHIFILNIPIIIDLSNQPNPSVSLKDSFFLLRKKMLLAKVKI